MNDDGVCINQLTSQDTVGATDLFPIWSGQNQDTRKVTGLAVATYVATTLVNTMVPYTQYLTPDTGFSVSVAPPTVGQNTRLLLMPAATLASGTVVLPGGGGIVPVDKQEVTVISTQIITTLTISAGTTTVTGAPTTIAANGHFKMFYDATNQSWFPA